jgi:hypothetical protein
MKKSLYMTTALVAAGVLAFGATDANAAAKAKKKAKKPVKMSISSGGFMNVLMGFGQNDGKFESTNGGTSRTHYDSFNMFKF